MVAIENKADLKSRYTNLVHEFKFLWTLNKFFLSLTDIQPAEFLPPVDMNHTYSVLAWLKRMVVLPQDATVATKMEEVTDELRSMHAWFNHLDERITPFMLRSHIESNKVNDRKILLCLAGLIFQKPTLSQSDHGKIDYLLVQAFSKRENGEVKLLYENVASMREEINEILPRQTDKNALAGYDEAMSTLENFIKRLETIGAFEELISGDYIGRGRQLKKQLRNFFYHPDILIKLVELNILLRRKFNELYKKEHAMLQQFSHYMAVGGVGLLDVSASVDGAAEEIKRLTESADQPFSTDYNENAEKLRSFLHIRELVCRTADLYGLDPIRTGEYPTANNLIDESQIQQKISDRMRSLSAQVHLLLRENKRSSVAVLRLEHTRLILSSWEKTALDDPNGCYDRQMISRAMALIAEINENYHRYNSGQQNLPVSSTILMLLNFYILEASRLAEDLEKLSAQMREKGQIEESCNLLATRHKLVDSYQSLNICQA